MVTTTPIKEKERKAFFIELSLLPDTIFINLNAEFQRTARKEKKSFLSYQCKETEESNRMGKTRDLFKKIRDTTGTFHAKMGTKKERNGMDLTEAEDIKKRRQDTQNYTKRSS